MVDFKVKRTSSQVPFQGLQHLGQGFTVPPYAEGKQVWLPFEGIRQHLKPDSGITAVHNSFRDGQMEIRNHSYCIMESECLRLHDIGTAHHIPFESDKIFLIERKRIPARKPLRDGRFRKMKGFSPSSNPLIKFLDCWNVVICK